MEAWRGVAWMREPYPWAVHRNSGHSKSAIDMSMDPVAFKKTKHIVRAAEFRRDLVARDVVRLQHLPGKVMVADLLTKAVARALFASLMDLIRQYAESGVACPG